MRTGVARYPGLHPLVFPKDVLGVHYDEGTASTTIRQFSSGRSHVLGLSDDGRIWSWEVSDEAALYMRFTNVEVSFGPQSVDRTGSVTKVVAGWNKSSAYVVGTGIVYWRPAGIQQGDDSDALVTCTKIPGTGLRRADLPRDYEDPDSFGEVRNHVVLEQYIVFITDLNKVYAFKESDADTGVVVELTTFSAPGREICDIHGSFRRFAILTASGEVLMGNEGMIESFYREDAQEHPEQLSQPNKPEYLQHTNIVSIAFGDHHFHALHAQGKISSHGVESGGSGSFGIGKRTDGANFRGVRYQDNRRPLQDNTFMPYASETPRYIWFEPEKRLWLSELERKANDGHTLTWNSVFRAGGSDIPKLYNQCIEREGEAWGEFPGEKPEEDDGLGAYFALTVAAGGWQSGALVLVNEELAEKIRLKHTVLVEEKDGENPPMEVIGAPSSQKGTSHEPRTSPYLFFSPNKANQLTPSF